MAVLGYVLALLLVGPTSAHAQASCYPPPCGSTATVAGADQLAGAQPAVSLIGETADPARSPAPFVAIGLLLVSVTFGIIAASRLTNLGGSRFDEGAQADAEVRRGLADARPIAQLSDVH